jgi:hypothetical protein
MSPPFASHRAIKLATLAPAAGRVGMKVAGNPVVFAEAAAKRGTRYKAGGRLNRSARAETVSMTGSAVRPRLDRASRRKREDGKQHPHLINARAELGRVAHAAGAKRGGRIP